jgi:hypothetical protein
MKTWIVALGALTSMMATGCDPVVLSPIGPPPAASTPGRSMLVMRLSDVNWNYEATPRAEILGPWGDPDAIVFFFSNEAQACETPLLPIHCPVDTTFWQLALAIPPALVRPGIISLLDNRIQLWAQADTPQCALNVGIGGAADISLLLGATLELIPNGAGLTAKLSGGVAPFGTAQSNGVEGPVFGVLSDGDYTGTFCGTVSLDPPPVPAIAVRGADSPPLPGADSSPDPDALVVFLGTLPDTCEDPLAAADCSWESRLRFTIPPALQMPGVLSLSDPALAATLTVQEQIDSLVCVNVPATSGTVEILSVDSSGVTFKVFQAHTLPEGSVYQSYTFDGVYWASTCP